MISNKKALKEVTLLLLVGAAFAAAACGDDDDTGDGGTSGSAGSMSTAGTAAGGSAGKGTGGSAGSTAAGTSSGGTSGSGGSATGGTSGSGNAGEPSGGVPSDGGSDGDGGAPLGGADAGGAGGEGGAPVVEMDMFKNGGFEDPPVEGGPNPPNGDSTEFPEWTNQSTPAGKSVIKWTDIHGGKVRLGQWSNAPYTARVEQTVEPIANGKYSFSIWVMRGAAEQLNESYLYAVGHDADAPTVPVTEETDAAIGSTTEYKKVTLENIEVTSGKLVVGMFTDANANGWINFDDAELTLLPE